MKPTPLAAADGQDVVAFVFPAPAPEQPEGHPERDGPGRGDKGRRDTEAGEGRSLDAGHGEEARQRAPAATGRCLGAPAGPVVPFDPGVPDAGPTGPLDGRR